MKKYIISSLIIALACSILGCQSLDKQQAKQQDKPVVVNNINVDNYYVKILTENGIVGVTAFGMMLLGLVGNGLRACVRTAKTRWSPLCAGMLCGLIGVLIHSVFESIWEEPYMMALFFAVAAMLAWAGLLRRRTQETA